MNRRRRILASQFASLVVFDLALLVWAVGFGLVDHVFEIDGGSWLGPFLWFVGIPAPPLILACIVYWKFRPRSPCRCRMCKTVLEKLATPSCPVCGERI